MCLTLNRAVIHLYRIDQVESSKLNVYFYNYNYSARIQRYDKIIFFEKDMFFILEISCPLKFFNFLNIRKDFR